MILAALALNHKDKVNYNRESISENEKLAGGDASGRVQR